MIALHLHPIHNALAVRYHPRGWDGAYAIQAMTLENGRWLQVGEPALFDRDLLERPAEAEPVASGLFELTMAKDQWTIRHRGGVFGRCKGSAVAIALEKARIEATGHSDGSPQLEDSPPTVQRIPRESDTDTSLV